MISTSSELTNLLRTKIIALEKEMMQHPQAEIETSHVFCDGMCARTIKVKAGTVIVGLIHLQDQLNIANGDITVITENGYKRYTGHHVIPSIAGTKRVGFANADTEWTTILRTNLTSPEEVEKMLTTNSFDDSRLNKTLELEGK